MKLNSPNDSDAICNSYLGSFDPRLLLLKINSQTNTILSEQHEFSALYRNSLHYSNTLIHETTHWSQFTATSWGNLVLTMNQCKTDSFINAAHYGDIKEILRESSFFRLTAYDQLDLKSIGKASHHSAIFIQNWLDKFCTFRLFTGGGSKYCGLDLSNSIATSLSDYISTIHHYYHENDCDRYSINLLDEQCKPDNFLQVGMGDGSVLTVNDLLESQSRANEVIYLMNFISTPETNAIKAEVFKKYMQKSSYWRAFSVYTKITNSKIGNASQFLEKLIRFNMLIDISLSPEWPPYGELNIKSQLSWNSFYPPLRFLIVCHADKKNFKSYSFDNTSEHIRFYSDTCKKVQWKSPLDLAEYYLDSTHKKKEGFRDWNESNAIDQSNLMKFGMHDYLQFIFREYSKFRLKFPTIIANYGASCCGNLLKENFNGIFDAPTWLSPPLAMNEESNKLKMRWPESHKPIFQWLTSHILHNQYINEVLLLEKENFFNLIPFEVPYFAKEYLKKIFSRNYGIDINI